MRESYFRAFTNTDIDRLAEDIQSFFSETDRFGEVKWKIVNISTHSMVVSTSTRHHALVHYQRY